MPEHAAYYGTQALDLVGTDVSTGAIKQVLSTVSGKLYNLIFAYTNNTDNTGANFGARVEANGFLTLLSNGFCNTGGTVCAPGWTLFSGRFIADSASTMLRFAT